MSKSMLLTNRRQWRLVAVVLAFAMVFAAFAGATVPASATTGDEPILISEPVLEGGSNSEEDSELAGDPGAGPEEAPELPELVEEPQSAGGGSLAEEPAAEVEEPLALSALSAQAGLTVGPGDTITEPGIYTIDPSASYGIIYIDYATVDPTNPSDSVTLVGNGAEDGDTPNAYLTIECIVYGVHLTLENVWISEPFKNGSIIDFQGKGNVLNSTGINILDGTDFANAASIHVDRDTFLDINGSPTQTPPPTTTTADGLYIYKDSTAAAIGGNIYEACGYITFESGSVFIKGDGDGAVVGGDSQRDTNGEIRIEGGQLSLEANGEGAAIGASDQGTCAGDVYITGGSTLINVDFTGSAIGYGESTNVGGYLHMQGGSLKCVVDYNAAYYWKVTPSPPYTDTITNIAITAEIIYDSKSSAINSNADVAEVDVSTLLSAPDYHLNVTAEPLGYAVDELYDDDGLNQYDFTPVKGSGAYTPDNWTADTATNKKLYLYLPTVPPTGALVATNAATPPATADWEYVYAPNPPNASTSFTLTPPANVHTVTFVTLNDSVYVDGVQVHTIDVEHGGTVTFAVVPNAGYAISVVNPTVGALTPNTGGVYTLSNVTANSSVTVTANAGTTYNVTFTGDYEEASIGGMAVTSAVTPDTSGTAINFTVTADDGYWVADVDSDSGTLTDNTDGSYTLDGVSADTTVTITTVPITTYEVTFVGGNDEVRVNGVATEASSIMTGGTLDFTVVPDMGYIVTGTPTADGGAVVTDDGDNNYTLSGATSDVTVTVPTAIDNSSPPVYWTAFAPVAFTGAGTIGSPYRISSVGNLVQLMIDVNSGDSHDGDYFYLAANLDLSSGSLLWVPIGGGRSLDEYGVETGNYFKGTFEGGGHTISGMTIEIPAANNGSAGYGLFGAASEGSIQNLAISGEISMPSDVAVDAVGSIVGYTTDSLYNCSSSVDITIGTQAPDDPGQFSSQIGGVVGIVRDDETDEEVSYIQYCYNSGTLTARSRLGGVVGAAYALTQDGVLIDQCYNTGAINGTSSDSMAYVGGVVGYNMGIISNSYNQASITIAVGSGGTNAGGVVGLLYGSDAISASLVDSYNTGTVSGGGTLEPLYGYTDVSPVTVTNCVYLDTSASHVQDQMSAIWVNVTELSDTDMRNNAISATRLSSGYYSQTAGSYPTLNWEAVSGNFGPIYVEQGGTGTTGVVGDPVGSLSAAAALQAQNPYRDTIVVTNNLTIAANTEISLTGSEARIVRGGDVTGDLITIIDGDTTFSGGTIDGYIEGGANGALFNLNGGTLRLGDGAVLENTTTTTNGGAVVITDGAMILDGGTIQNNVAASGGGIYVAAGGMALINGGTIEGNSAPNGGGIYVVGSAMLDGGMIASNASTSILTNNGGGGVYVGNGGTVALSYTTIQANTAANGAGVHIASGGTFSMTGGTITGNTATSTGTGYAGGVNLAGGATATLSGGAISNNTAKTSGGGVRVSGNDASLTISGTSVTGNSTNGSGGGVSFVPDNSTTVFTLSGTGSITANSASTGGGVHMNYGTFNMTGGEISDNLRSSGVYMSGGTFNLSGGTVDGNVSTGNGAGICAYTGYFYMSGGTVSSNTTTTGNGGGIAIGNDHANTITGGTITGNSAVNGGGVSITTGTLTVSGDTVISDNTATGTTPITSGGGGIYASTTSTGGVTIAGGTISGNEAGGNGGGLYVLQGTATLSGGMIGGTATGMSNSAVNGGGVGIAAGATFALTGGTITGNIGTTGNGVWLYSSSAHFTLSPSGTGAVTFGGNDVIYLTTGAYINVGAALTGVTGTVPVTMATTAVGTLVAQKTSAFNATELGKFVYVDGMHTFQRTPAPTYTQITLAS